MKFDASGTLVWDVDTAAGIRRVVGVSDNQTYVADPTGGSTMSTTDGSVRWTTTGGPVGLGGSPDAVSYFSVMCSGDGSSTFVAASRIETVFATDEGQIVQGEVTSLVGQVVSCRPSSLIESRIRLNLAEFLSKLFRSINALAHRQAISLISRLTHFTALASGFPDDREALPIRADARVLGAVLVAGERIRQPLQPFRHAYLVVASGRIEVDGELVGPSDGLAITNADAIDVSALEDSELLLVQTN